MIGISKNIVFVKTLAFAKHLIDENQLSMTEMSSSNNENHIL